MSQRYLFFSLQVSNLLFTDRSSQLQSRPIYRRNGVNQQQSNGLKSNRQSSNKLIRKKIPSAPSNENLLNIQTLNPYTLFLNSVNRAHGVSFERWLPATKIFCKSCQIYITSYNFLVFSKTLSSM